MIDKREILELAREFGLAANVVEKDYVLGWLLAGVFNNPVLNEDWVFKGGTCLKKCYFETYRFSEDLDFTLKSTEHLDEPFLVATFQEIAEWIYEHSGIEIPIEAVRFDVRTNPRGHPSAQGRISYRGPLQPRGDLPRIKLDITADERLVLDPVARAVHHPYSDEPGEGFQIQCYCFEELFAEKLRALTERERPRDLYDVVHLYRNGLLTADRVVIVSTLREKCAFRGIAVPTMTVLSTGPHRAELESEWSNMLGHQLPELPPFESFWEELPLVLAWLFEEGAAVAAAASFPVRGAIDASWRPPAMVQAWGLTVPLEVIRFAAANRLCVELAYGGSTRLIEPYSLRRTQEGNILLHAVRHEDNEHRSYRIDRIEGARVTRVSFVPRYAVELAQFGSLSIPSTARAPRAPVRLSSRSAPKLGPRYIVQCPICSKRFERKSYDVKLNAHKDTQGYQCSGRTGYLVETQY
ncbi:MAG: nucleotidyl transferase AbiEii/AbiGii toxin family protein [Acidobacteriota bacterium]